MATKPKTEDNKPKTVAPAPAAPKKKASKQLAERPETKSIALLDAELAAEAGALSAQLGQAQGRKIKFNPDGNITAPDGQELGNTIDIIVVDFISANKFYARPYDPKSIVPPDCYAIGKEIATMKPEPDSPSIQSDDCASCPMNQFGSDARGKGKACQNRRQLAVLVVDPEAPDAHNEPDAPLHLIDISPTSLQSFDGCAKGIQRAMNGPPIKAIIRIETAPVGERPTYCLLKFSFVEPNQDYGKHVARRAEAAEMLNRKPDFAAMEAQAKQPARRGGPAPRKAVGARR